MEDEVKNVIEQLSKEDKWLEEVKDKIETAEITNANILCFTIKDEEGMIIIDLGKNSIYKAQKIERKD